MKILWSFNFHLWLLHFCRCGGFSYFLWTRARALTFNTIKQSRKSHQKGPSHQRQREVVMKERETATTVWSCNVDLRWWLSGGGVKQDFFLCVQALCFLNLLVFLLTRIVYVCVLSWLCPSYNNHMFHVQWVSVCGSYGRGRCKCGRLYGGNCFVAGVECMNASLHLQRHSTPHNKCAVALFAIVVVRNKSQMIFDR